MSWLNNNAPAVQAIAAVVSVLVTTVLAFITWRYVRLTGELSETARQELHFLKGERAAQKQEARQHLLTLILHLRKIANQFSGGPSQGEQIRKVTLWSDSSLDDLRSLAVAFGPTVADLAAEASRHLSTIAELAISVQQTPRATGVDWIRFDWTRWKQAIEGAERCLVSLLDRVEPNWRETS